MNDITDPTFVISDIGLRTYGDIVIDLSVPILSNITLISNGSITPNTTYYYKLAAFDHEDGESSASDPVSLQTTYPNRSIQLTWSDIIGSIRYSVYRSSSGLDDSWDLFSNVSSPWVDYGVLNASMIIDGTSETPKFYNNAFITKISNNQTSWIDVGDMQFILSDDNVAYLNNGELNVSSFVSASDPFFAEHLTTKRYVDDLVHTLGVNGSIFFPDPPHQYSTDINLNMNGTADVGESFWKVDNWIRTHLIDTPPAPSFVANTTTEKGVQIYWKNPDRIPAGFGEFELPYIEDIYVRWRSSIQRGNESAWIPSIDGQPTGSNTSDINNMANSAIFFVESGDHTNNLNRTVWEDYGRIKTELEYDFEIWGTNFNNDYGTVPMFDIHRLGNTSIFANISSQIVGIPISPSNVTVIANTSTSLTLHWKKPDDHNDQKAGNQQCPFIDTNMIQYYTTATLSANGIRNDTHLGINATFTAPIAGGNSAEDVSGGDTALTIISGLFPGHTYEFLVAAKNYINSINGTNSLLGYGPNSTVASGFTDIPPPPEFFKETDCTDIDIYNWIALRGPYDNQDHYALNGSILTPASDGQVYVFRQDLLNDTNLILEQTITKRRTNYSVGALDTIDVTTITGYGGPTSTYLISNGTSEVKLTGFAGGFSTAGDYSSTPVSNAGVTLYVEDDSDHYVTTGLNGGFWKSTNVQIGGYNSNVSYTASTESYSLQVKYDILGNETIYSDPFIFYVDNLVDLPELSEYFVIDVLPNDKLEYITGIPTYITYDRIQVQFNIQNLTGFFLRPDKLHATLELRSGYGLGELVAEPIYIHQSDIGCDHFYYNTTDYSWEKSLELHDDGILLSPNLGNTSIQFNTFFFSVDVIDKYIFTEDIKACFVAHNIVGNTSAVYSDVKVNGTVISNHEIRIDNNSKIIKDLFISNSNSTSGLLVNSSTGIAPDIFGGEYIHEESIVNTSINAHLFLIDGLFRTAYDNLYFKDYSNYYFPGEIIAPDYSLINPNERRYATFKFTGIYLCEGRFTIEFINSNLPTAGGLIPFPDHCLEVKVVGAGDNDTGWMDGNKPHDGVNDYWNGGKIVVANGSSPQKRLLYCRPGTDLRNGGYMYIRVAFEGQAPYRFQNIELTVGFPNTESSLNADISNTGVPDVPTNGTFFGTINPSDFILQWIKPVDHNINLAGNQITPFIERNIIQYQAINTTSVNGLNSDIHFGGNSTFTKYETIKNSAEISSGSDIARYTLINLMPGHLYEFRVASKNTLNHTTLINSLPGYGNNSSIFLINTNVPVSPDYFKTSDCIGMDTDDRNILSNHTTLECYCSLDGNLLNVSGDGVTYVLFYDLLNDTNLTTTQTIEKRRTHSDPSIYMDTNVSIITGYGGLTTTFDTDPQSQVILTGFEGNEGVLGDYSGTPISNGGVTLYVVDDSDHYTIASNHDGFWKSTNVYVGANNSQNIYLPSQASYSFKIEFEVINALTITSDPFVFYVDDLVNLPVISEYFINTTIPNNTLQYICGIPIYVEDDLVQVQFNMNNLAQRFIRGDKKHTELELIGDSGTGALYSKDSSVKSSDIRFNPFNFYYNTSMNPWNTSYELHNVDGNELELYVGNDSIQFNTFTIPFVDTRGIYNEDIVACFTGLNIRGNSSTVCSDVKFPVNGSVRINHRIRIDGVSLETLELIDNSKTSCGELVSSSKGVAPVTFGNIYDHTVPLTNTTINEHLLLVNGLFRTPLAGGGVYFKDYSEFYFPEIIAPDYTNISMTEYRYATFKYTDVIIGNGTATVEIKDSNFATSGGLLPYPGMSLEIKVNGTGTHDTGWLDINTPHDGVDDYIDGGNMVHSSGSTPQRRLVFLKPGTDVYSSGEILIRIGLKGDYSYFFKYITIVDGFPAENLFDGTDQTIGIPNAPSNLIVYQQPSESDVIIQWKKATDHNSFQIGNQIVPYIQQNMIQYQATYTESLNGLNQDVHLGPSNARFTDFQTSKNSGEISSGSNLARMTVSGLTPGHQYELKVSSKNIINSVNGTNSVRGYGPNSSTLIFTTDDPLPPKYLQLSDCANMSQTNINLLRNTYDVDLCHINGTSLQSSHSNHSYVFRNDLLNDVNLVTDLTPDRRRTALNPHRSWDFDVSIITGYGGPISTYDTTDPVSYITLTGAEPFERTGGDYIGGPIANGGVTMYVINDTDYYTVTSNNDGFWKGVNFQVGSNGSSINYPASTEAYAFKVKQDLLSNGSIGLTLETDAFIFYIEDLVDTPNISEGLVINSTIQKQDYISGLPIYIDDDVLSVQYNINNLGKKFIREDKRHTLLTIVTANGTGDTISNYTYITMNEIVNDLNHSYYDVPVNPWNTSIQLHNINGTELQLDLGNGSVQFNDYSIAFYNTNGTFNDNVVVCFEGINIVGNGTTYYSDIRNIITGDYPTNHLLRVDGKSRYVRDFLINSNTSFGGELVNSSIGIAPVTFGDKYIHEFSIVDTSVNEHLLLVNGKFRTPNIGITHFKDYNQFYFPNVVLPDYSVMLGETTRRYATFRYGDINLVNGKMTIEFIYSNMPTGGGLLPLAGMSLEVKIINTTGQDTGWMDANTPHDGVDDYIDGGKMVKANGSTPQRRLVFCRAGTNLMEQGDLYIRVGFDGDRNYYFEYLKLTNGFPDPVTGQLPSSGIPNAPSNGTMIGNLSYDSLVIQWEKPTDHDDQEPGIQVYPFIKQNMIQYYSINSTSANGLDIDEHFGPGNAVFTSYETYFNSGEVSSGSIYTQKTLGGLYPGTTYDVVVASSNLFNNINGTNTIGGYGPNSTSFQVTTLPPEPLYNYLQVSDGQNMSVTNINGMNGSYNMDVVLINDVPFISSSDGEVYIFRENLINDLKLKTKITDERRRINQNASILLDTNVSIITAYGGQLSSYDTIDPASHIILTGFEGSEGTAGNYSSVPVSNGSVTLYVTDDGDDYGLITHYDGFWKSANFQVGANNASTNYVASVAPYAFRLEQQILYNNTVNMTIQSNPFIFYIDNLIQLPIVTEQLVLNGFLGSIQQYVLGVPTYVENDYFAVQFNVKHLGNKLLRADKKHAYISLQTNNGIGVVISNYSTFISGFDFGVDNFYYNTPVNGYEPASTLHNGLGITLAVDAGDNLIQFKTFDVMMRDTTYIYDENIVAGFSGINVIGNSSTAYSDFRDIPSGNVSFRHLIRVDGVGIALIDLISDSTTVCGKLVHSGIGVAPTVFGSNIDHSQSIIDTSVNAQLFMINGRFRTSAAAASTYLKDYTIYRFPNSVIGPNYTPMLGDTQIRYATFKYTDIDFSNGKMTIEFINSNFPVTEGLLPLPNISVEVKVACAGIFNTGWMNANRPHDGVNDYLDNGRCVRANGSTPQRRLVFCRSGTELTNGGALYIRVGITGNYAYYFEYIRVTSGFTAP
jgi:hypothetical protein